MFYYYKGSVAKFVLFLIDLCYYCEIFSQKQMLPVHIFRCVITTRISINVEILRIPHFSGRILSELDHTKQLNTLSIAQYNALASIPVN